VRAPGTSADADRERFSFRGERPTLRAEFFARLRKRAGLMKTRTCDLATLGVRPSRIALWQKVNTRSWCCGEAVPSRPHRAGIYEGIAKISLYAFFTPVPEYYAPTLPVALYRCRYRFDERTNVDLLHTWWLLRLLFVFLLACPFLIIPVLLSFFKKQPDAEDRTEAPVECGTRVEVSGRGTWNAQADGRSQSSTTDGALSPKERRAA
jgi:hypothetical protein